MAATLTDTADWYLPTYNPLTTAFTAPPQCTSSYIVKVSNSQKVWTVTERADEACFPKHPSSTAIEFSPGIYCPHGFTANHIGARTDYGSPGIPETRLDCSPRRVINLDTSHLPTLRSF